MLIRQFYFDKFAVLNYLNFFVFVFFFLPLGRYWEAFHNNIFPATSHQADIAKDQIEKMETRILTVKTKASAYPPKWLMIIEEKFNLVRAHSVANRCVLSETSCFLYQILSHHIWVVKEQTKKQQEKNT